MDNLGNYIPDKVGRHMVDSLGQVGATRLVRDVEAMIAAFERDGGMTYRDLSEKIVALVLGREERGD